MLHDPFSSALPRRSWLMTVSSLCRCIPFPYIPHFPWTGFISRRCFASPLLIGALADVRIDISLTPSSGIPRVKNASNLLVSHSIVAPTAVSLSTTSTHPNHLRPSIRGGTNSSSRPTLKMLKISLSSFSEIRLTLRRTNGRYAVGVLRSCEE